MRESHERGTFSSVQCFILLAIILALFGCGGGGGGGGGDGSAGGSASTITLSSVTPSRSTAIASTPLVRVTINFGFTDSDGDLDGGTVKVDWGGQIVTIAIPPSWAGAKGGSSYVTLSFAELSQIVGDITVWCWLTDKVGHESSRQSFVFHQTAPNWPWQWGTAQDDDGAGIAVDSTNNIYVAGAYGVGSANPGGFVAKYSPASMGQGIVFMSGRAGRAIAIDGAGSIYAVGATFFPAYSASVLKYDSNGDQLWEKGIATSPGDVLARGVAMDGVGSVFVTGSTSGDLDGNGNSGGYDFFVIKYDGAGNRQWTRLLGTSDDDLGTGVVTDSGNSVYVTGSTAGDLDGNANPGAGIDAGFMTKYDTAGAKQWTILIGAGSDARAAGIARDGADNLYIVGDALGNVDGALHPNPGSTASFLARYDTSGNRQWTQILGSVTSTGSANAVAVDHNNAIYVTGVIYGTLDAGHVAQGADAFLAKYDSAGTMQWVTLFGTSQDEMGYGLAVDGNNFVYITGYTTGSLSGYSNAGSRDVFIAKFDENGIRQ